MRGVFGSHCCVLPVIDAQPGIKEGRMQSHLINFDSRIAIDGYVLAVFLF